MVFVWRNRTPRIQLSISTTATLSKELIGLSWLTRAPWITTWEAQFQGCKSVCFLWFGEGWMKELEIGEISFLYFYCLVISYNAFWSYLSPFLTPNFSLDPLHLLKPQCYVLFFNNPPSSICSSHVFLGIEPFTRVWSTYQGLQP